MLWTAACGSSLLVSFEVKRESPAALAAASTGTRRHTLNKGEKIGILDPLALLFP
jgi:hypothetical protein